MNCEHCGKEFPPHPQGCEKRFCSPRCRRLAEKARYYERNKKRINDARRKGPLIPWVIEKPKKISEKSLQKPATRAAKPQKDRQNIDEIRKKNSERARKSRQRRTSKEIYEKRKLDDPTYRYKEQARSKLRYAVKIGKIVKPARCERCGSEKRLEAHHYRGYEHPYDVIWLCHICHAAHHSLNPTKNPPPLLAFSLNG